MRLFADLGLTGQTGSFIRLWPIWRRTLFGFPGTRTHLFGCVSLRHLFSVCRVQPLSYLLTHAIYGVEAPSQLFTEAFLAIYQKEGFNVQSSIGWDSGGVPLPSGILDQIDY